MPAGPTVASLVSQHSANVASSMKLVLAQVQMSEQEYVAVMDKNKSWPFPAVQDGWVKAHDAVRMDMMDMHQALDCILDRLEGGEPVQPWMISNLQKWWPFFEHQVHHHHDNEEHIVFPVLSQRIKLPPKMTADHVTLLKDMSDIAAIIKGLKPHMPAQSDYVTFCELRDRFRSFRQEMCEHLLEEEVIGLALMRKHMTVKDFKPIEKKLMAHASLALIGWILRAFPNDEARVEWMTHMAHIPRLVQQLLLLPAAKKHDRTITRLMVEIKQNRQLPKRSKKHMLCFVAH